MKKLILSLAFILSFATLNIAQGDKGQNREESRKRIDASKVAYLTTYLDLTSEESAKFWPVYNAYQAELKAIRGPRGERKSASEMTDAEAATKIDQYVSGLSQKADLAAKYIAKYREILSDKKVYMIHKAEGEFKKQMVKRYADRRGNKDGARSGDRKK